MKIAVSTDDFKNVTGHVGRCEGFLIFEIENGEINGIEKLGNIFTNHRKGNHHENHSHGNGGHTHSELAEALSGCEVLITHGAGPRLVDDLTQNGTHVVFTDELVAVKAAISYQNGTLNIIEKSVCKH
ncbi:MAG: hypothetical protein K9J12_04435 [Melioribacteraceae bacterium]|nr:hypothetical protein [Melioribacteraceae bacterium]MCF8263562.1 hypothetical protein [Melioribacteraceae bacterium]MCF8431243.1 hypothetical protein [Melioribacteraceae bacterium]